jgi:hypothetical protein
VKPIADVIEFKPKPQVHIYIVDEFYVVAAHTPEDAIRIVQEEDDKDDEYSIRMIDDEKQIYAIKSGKVELQLWDREPRGLEQLAFVHTPREFVDQYLKRRKFPIILDIIEDTEGVIIPKK